MAKTRKDPQARRIRGSHGAGSDGAEPKNGSTQSPEIFYQEATKRPNIRKILEKLAKL